MRKEEGGEEKEEGREKGERNVTDISNWIVNCKFTDLYFFGNEIHSTWWLG